MECRTDGCGNRGRQPSGLCKRCNDRAYYARNRERAKARQRAYNARNASVIAERDRVRNTNPDRIAQRKKADRLRRERKRDEIKAVQAICRARPENRAKARAAAKAWREANPERERENGRLSDARRYALECNASVGQITKRDISRLVARHRGRCVYCDQPYAHLDHVVPLARGGAHSLGNLVPACAPCNQSKNKWLLVEWKYRIRRSVT